MSTIIIGIHGLANKPKRGLLEDYWRASISEGLRKNCNITAPLFDLRLVYWADLLYKYPLHYDQAFTFDPLYNDEPYVEADEGAIKEYKDSWRDDLAAGALDIVGSTLDGLKRHLGIHRIADFFLARLLKDLAFYYEGHCIRGRQGDMEPASKVLRDELKAALLAEKHRDIMIIAHSMGSIITYDTLRDLGMPGTDYGLHVRGLVTIGSPLGLPHVKTKILEERDYDSRLRTPSIVTGFWSNFADRKDPVAMDVHLRDDFGANAEGVQVEDDLVLNDYHKPGRPDQPNHHKSYGYLRCPEVSARIRSFLGL